MHHPTDRITHTTAFVTPVVEHWLERETKHALTLLAVNKKLNLIFAEECKCNPLVQFSRFEEGRKETLYLTTHSTHFIYDYMASDMVKDHSDREETRCRHMGYSFRLTARVLLYASSLRQESTYHGLCYTSRGALAGTSRFEIDPHW